MSTIIRLLLLCLALFSSVAKSEDWKTTDGKTYQEVKVVKVQVDTVTILYKDGGVQIPLSTLPSDLQERFHYNSVLASEKISSEKKEQEQIDFLKENKLRAGGTIVQIFPNGVILKGFFTDFVQKNYKNQFNEGAYVSCNTTGLSENKVWEGFVWSIGDYSYTTVESNYLI